MSGIISNLRNVIQGRDSKNNNSESTSTQIKADTEKLVSIKEVTPEINETISQTEETQLEQESLIEKEEFMVSDIKTEPTTLTEVEIEATSSSKLKSTSIEKAITETSKLPEVSGLKDSYSSSEKTTSQDSQNEE